MGSYTTKISNTFKIPNIFEKIKQFRIRTSKIEAVMNELEKKRIYNLEDSDLIKERFFKQPAVAEVLSLTTTILEEKYASSLSYKIEIEYDWDDEDIVIMIPTKDHNPDIDDELFEISELMLKRFGTISNHVFVMSYIAAEERIENINM
ncbi:hypothetical protein MsAg5_03390 [Methanosarcinaceae archaeon Ag5]|uniref:Uncharacterized protein n=1 Tax=Methanolapillus africanus TaxID=3028297 RepID=A0AAE4SEN7_9EURY|nr:hypothetical protein [Methanosarcinaceae archaeon Ag5]